MLIKDKPLFLAMCDIFFGGEFSEWLAQQALPFAAAREYEEARQMFAERTGFDFEEAEAGAEEARERLAAATRRQRPSTPGAATRSPTR